MFLLSAVLIGQIGCKPRTLAPYPEFTEPELSVDTHGYFQGSTATIDGRAHGLDTVTVNGAEAFRNDDAYQATVDLERGVNMIEVQGIDERGDPHILRQGVVSGTFASPDAAV
ncbi:MAG: hypothetical protein KC656_01155 [Myxococcales bacterium]|nr:hypothetical protein [Myxococcales bacterium]